MAKEIVVIKLGGSMLSKSEELKFDFDFATRIKDVLDTFSETHQFILILGGGYLARSYQQFLKQYSQFFKRINGKIGFLFVSNLFCAF